MKHILYLTFLFSMLRLNAYAQCSVSGTFSVCAGSTTSLSASCTGGTWSSSYSSVATVNVSTGIVTGVSAGTTIISYSGSSSPVTITVNALPANITGAAMLCTNGNTLTLSDITLGGTWTSSNTANATIDPGSGFVTDVAVGGDATVTFTYTIANGCSATTSMQVNPDVTTSPTTGLHTICLGGTEAIWNDVRGGYYSSSNTSVATITHGGGTITPHASGITIITYDYPGCPYNADTFLIYVPGHDTVQPASISGALEFCEGTYSALSDATIGGVWSSSNTRVTIDPTTGLAYGAFYGGGVATITYSLPTGCFTMATVTTDAIHVIAGPTSVCAGSSIILSDATTGGAWSSSNTSVATIDASSGVVTSIAAGTATISYSALTCFKTYNITVNAMPAAIAGTMSICNGSTASLSDALIGGIWHSSTPSVATISTAGVVASVAPGTTTISYTNGSCRVTAIFTVNTQPTAILGTRSACNGFTSTLSDATAGGAWSSSNTSVATVISSGVVTGVGVGTATISYSIGSCASTAAFTVNVQPAAITGASSVCSGSTTALADATAGGAWHSSTPSVASINPSGVVTGTATGTTTISYTIGSCRVTAAFTVNTQPTAILGTRSACNGFTSTLSDATAGGAWSSSNTSVATVISLGVVTGVGVGTATISYSIGSCASTAAFTVNVQPAAITGASSVCSGSTTALADATAGGAWHSSTPSVASINPSGVVTGTATGTTTISYTIGSCRVTAAFNVNAQPTAILGTKKVCAGSTTTLSDITLAGAWSSGDETKATVSGSGVVTGIAAGTTTISYTLGTGCYVTATVTVNPLPTVYTLASSGSLCSGSASFSIILSNADAGISYQLYNGGSTSGSPFTGLGSSHTWPGPYTTGGPYTVVAKNLATLCTQTMSGSISILPLPTITLGAGPTVCAGTTGASLPYTATSGSPASYTITWGSAALGAGFVNVGSTPLPLSAIPLTVPGSVAPGTYAGILTPANPCAGAGIPFTVTVIALPSITPGLIPAVCPGTPSVHLPYTATGGPVSYTIAWSSAALGVGFTEIYTTPLSGSPLLFPISPIAPAGVYNGTITVYNHTCRSVGAVFSVVINPLPDPGAITGSSIVCAGSSVTLIDPAVGGIWSSSDGTIATVDGLGNVTGVSGGAITISYTVSNSCGTASTILPFTVNPLPISGIITGSSTVCAGSSVTLIDPAVGGIWSSSDGTIAIVDGLGNVTGVSAGAVTISYTVSNSCGTASAILPFTVNPLPDAGIITGSSTVCVGSSVTLIDPAVGGIWSSSDGAIATVDGLGNVTGTSAGAVTISYSVSNICGVATAVLPFTVNPLPDAGIITGSPTVCVGASFGFADVVPGGLWSSSDGTIAGVDGLGNVTGISAGPVTISYSVSNSCGIAIATLPTVISPLPDAGIITGSSTVCAGSLVTLIDPAVGGLWSSGDGTIAGVDGLGNVTGVSAGAVTISYRVTNICGAATATYLITTDPLPDAGIIAGATTICAGPSVTLIDLAVGGLWSSSDGTIAGVDGLGNVTGVSAGAVTISYSVSNSCGIATAILPFTVNPLPDAGIITGGSSVCIDAAIDLADAVPGGTWSSSGAGIIAVDALGVATGIAVGTATISYSVSNSCGTATATLSIIVNPLPDAGTITGCVIVCLSSSIALSDVAAGGVWSSSNTAVATVDVSGNVSGISTGTATITYSVTSGCGTSYTTYAITVATEVWTGGTSTNWNTASNWSCGSVPTLAENVLIPAGTTYSPEILASATGYANNITINTGVTVTLDASAILMVAGNIIDTGIVTGTGEIYMHNSTSSAQTIYGNGMVSNLELDNTGGASTNSVYDSLGITGTLTLTNGQFTTNNTLILYSNTSGTGRIGTITGGSISGGIVDEQATQTGGFNKSRFWCTPFDSSITLQQFQLTFNLEGYPGSLCYNATETDGRQNFVPHWYNILDGSYYRRVPFGDPGWSRMDDICIGANDTNRLHRFQSVILPIVHTPITVRLFGAVNTGDVNITLQGNDSTDYNMVGNPYPSPVDIGQVIYRAWQDSLLVGDYYWVWDPYVTGSLGLGAYDAIKIDSNGGHYYIEENAGFQLRARYGDGSSVLNFHETDKVATYYKNLVRSQNLSDGSLSLLVYDMSYQLSDKLQLRFTDAATDYDDGHFDAAKPLMPLGLNFCSWSANNTRLSIDYRPYKKGNVVPLGIYSEFQEPFVMKVANMPATNGELYLHDKWLHRFISLQQGTEYQFDITDDPASQGDGRFELTMGVGDETTLALNTRLAFSITPNPAKNGVKLNYEASGIEASKIKVMNVTGIVVYEANLGIQQSGNEIIDLSNFSAGVYLVEFSAGDEKVVKKLVIEK